MPSTVYKGDLSEITFGHEASLYLEHDYAGTFRIICSFDNGGNAANAPHHDLVKDTSVITFTGGIANTPVNAGILRYPNGMLVGSRLVFNASGNFSADDYNSTGRIYTIVKQEVANDGNNDNDGKTEITVTPALKSGNSAADVTSAAGDAITILPFATPTIDVSMTHADAANASGERVLTDQFVGLVSTVALPETKVDLKRYHVVGLGRDVAVQVPGRFTNQGGAFECNIHNSRWFKYCLGQHVSKPLNSATENAATGTYILATGKPANPGDSYIEITDDGGTDTPSFGGTGVGVGDYVILDTAAEMVDVQTYRETAIGGGLVADAWPAVNATQIFDKAIKQQIRRIVGFHTASGDSKIWLDQPLDYGHPVSGTVVTFARYATDSSNGSPDRGTDGGLTNGIEHLYFSRSTVPSFAMEVSVRRRDLDSNAGTTDGGTGDSKQLTRVFRGCKVKDFSMTADTDAALRLSVNFDSALCYTDTGRLETLNKGDRYDTHRLFEDTGHNELSRKVSGIEKGTQKPFMFYNGTMRVLGQSLGQVVSFTLNGKTGVEQFYTISGANVADSATDQVPFAGTRNPTLAVEGKTEYDLEMEIIVDDPIFYHNMRRAVANFDDTDEAGQTDADMIRLTFTKSGSGATRENLEILIDDYFITEAPLPIPEDKGPIRSKLKILPKSIKIIGRDTILSP
jgi:hypothetical protein